MGGRYALMLNRTPPLSVACLAADALPLLRRDGLRVVAHRPNPSVS
jgi:hypothetical protein